MKYRFNGKEKRLAFGVYPAVSLAQARALRDEAKKKLNSAREITFDKFRTEKAQYIMEFVEEEYPELKGGEV